MEPQSTLEFGKIEIGGLCFNERQPSPSGARGSVVGNLAASDDVGWCSSFTSPGIDTPLLQVILRDIDLGSSSRLVVHADTF